LIDANVRLMAHREPFSSSSSVDHTPEFAGDEGLDVPFASSLNLNATVDSNSSTLGTDRLDSGRIWESIKLAITPRGTFRLP
jgi:hypothetical protein